MNSQQLNQKLKIREIQTAIQTYKHNELELLTPLTVNYLRQNALGLFNELSQRRLFNTLICKLDSQSAATYIFLVLFRSVFLGKQEAKDSEINYFSKKLIPVQKKLEKIRNDKRIKNIWCHNSVKNANARKKLSLKPIDINEKPHALTMHLIDDLIESIENLNFDLFKIILLSKKSVRVYYASLLKTLNVNFFNTPNYKLICLIINSKKIKDSMGLKVISKERSIEKEISRYEKNNNHTLSAPNNPVAEYLKKRFLQSA